MSAALTAAITAAGVTGAAGAFYAGPVLARVAVIGDRVAPRLVGWGRSDHVALTFDDGPDPASTPAFLAELDRLGWHATFFLLGRMTRQAPSLAAEIVAAGHEVGVHGDDHRSMLSRGPISVRREIARTTDVVADAAGVAPRWFRPPFGALSYGALSGARRAGLDTVLWTSWGRDWRAEATPESVLADVLRRDVAGGTVLLHDSDCESAPGSWHAALGALAPLAEHLQERDLTVGSLGEHGLGRQNARV
ncbi:MAG TPA: polysaccharide deacetylase family protein [Acidimicrobiia bacterium]|nr:polysaccharide deacetylase family protein [Acidimicrobiia bacterium]